MGDDPRESSEVAAKSHGTHLDCSAAYSEGATTDVGGLSIDFMEKQCTNNLLHI